MKSRRSPAALGIAAVAGALVLAAGVPAACGGSSPAPPSASPTATRKAVATPTPVVTPRFRDSDVQGIRLKVASWLGVAISQPAGEGGAGGNVYAGPAPGGEAGGAFIVVGVHRMASPPDADAMIRALDAGRTVAGILPKLGEDAVTKLTRRARRTTIGAGWPAVSAMYRVSVPRTSEVFFRQRRASIELVYFVRGKRVYFVLLGAAPPIVFEAHREELETTLRSVKRLP